MLAQAFWLDQLQLLHSNSSAAFDSMHYRGQQGSCAPSEASLFMPIESSHDLAKTFVEEPCHLHHSDQQCKPEAGPSSPEYRVELAKYLERKAHKLAIKCEKQGKRVQAYASDSDIYSRV